MLSRTLRQQVQAIERSAFLGIVLVAIRGGTAVVTTPARLIICGSASKAVAQAAPTRSGLGLEVASERIDSAWSQVTAVW